ncbi:hypothetical protein [Baaleninema simplex]|nr:hypothetical protein [Baaleninema simplex]
MSVTVQSKQFTLADYHRLVEVGFFREGDRTDFFNLAQNGCISKL